MDAIEESGSTEFVAPPAEVERLFTVPEDYPGVTYRGHIDEVTRFYVTGWVADTDDWSRSLRVIILINGQPVGEIEASDLRQGLRELAPDATGRYVFRYYFADPLSMYCENRVSVRVSGTDVYLVEPPNPIPAIGATATQTAGRPAAPVLVTTCGRTGSTVIMAELARHPHVVVAGQRPFEVEMGTYYGYALRTLSAAADPVRSLRSDRITATENRFHIGFNPYFEQAVAAQVFKNPDRMGLLLNQRVPSHLAQAFREIILDFYQQVAIDQGIAQPLYFAEKTLPERDGRLGIRFMFPNVREVLLVRDFRDIVCSSMATKGAQFDLILEDTMVAAQDMTRIRQEAGDTALLLRYEDYVLHKQQTLARLFGFLGLAVPAEPEQGLKTLFDVHATSQSPEASIGRWKRDLTPEQQARCEVFGPWLAELGY